MRSRRWTSPCASAVKRVNCGRPWAVNWSSGPAFCCDQAVDALDRRRRLGERRLELAGDRRQVGRHLSTAADTRSAEARRSAVAGATSSEMIRSAPVKALSAAASVRSAEAIAGPSRSIVALACRKVAVAASSVVAALAATGARSPVKVGDVGRDLVDGGVDRRRAPRRTSAMIAGRSSVAAFSIAAAETWTEASVVRASATSAVPSPSTRVSKLVAAESTEASAVVAPSIALSRLAMVSHLLEPRASPPSRCRRRRRARSWPRRRGSSTRPCSSTIAA